MEKSALQIARAAYQPKLPKALQGAVTIKEGEPTQSVADQEEIKKLFPNTYGMPLIKFENAAEAANFAPMNVGVILSGGQAPGGHNVMSGLFDGLKKLNPANRLYGFLLRGFQPSLEDRFESVNVVQGTGPRLEDSRAQDPLFGGVQQGHFQGCIPDLNT